MNSDTFGNERLATALSDESAATQFLLERCGQQRAPSCPRCRGAKLYRLADRRNRCASCRYTFSDFAARWLSVGGLHSREWIVLLRAFAGGATVQAIQSRIGVVYSTAHKAVTTVRRAIAAHATDARLLDLVIFAEGKDRADAGRGLVFGVDFAQEPKRISVVTGLTVAEILVSEIPRTQIGSIVYTDGAGDYLGFSFWHPEKIAATCSEVRVWSQYRALWEFTDQWRQRRRRVSAWQYALHAKEMEFRINHIGADGCATLLDYVCDWIPTPGSGSPATASIPPR